MGTDMNKYILITGNRSSGKTSAARMLAERYGCGYRDISDMIVPAYARKIHERIEYVESQVHEEVMRQRLYSFAAEKAKDDPAYWIKQALAVDGVRIVSGVRRAEEFAAGRYLFDLHVHIDRLAAVAQEDDFVVSADHKPMWVGNNGSLGELRERGARQVEKELVKPECYICGRYRHYKDDGGFDDEIMDMEHEEERFWADIAFKAGYRVFSPIGIHAALDHIFDGKRIIDLCCERVKRMSSADVLLLRAGWDWFPASEGAVAEFSHAADGPMHVVHSEMGTGKAYKALVNWKENVSHDRAKISTAVPG